jgi:hypothetical protein
MKDQLKPIIRNEVQFLYLCHLIGPFLQRFHGERMRCLLEVSTYRVLNNCPAIENYYIIMPPQNILRGPVRMYTYIRPALVSVE